MKLYQRLAQLVGAYHRCAKTPDTHAEWRDRHAAEIHDLVKRHMPSGSGFDAGTTIDLDGSTEDRLVFVTDFHHMDDTGFYDWWTSHVVRCSPSLALGFRLSISDRDRNGISGLIAESFEFALNTEVTP